MHVASAQKVHKYDFGSELGVPSDVALYAPCNSADEYVLVADPGLNALVRYDGDGTSDSIAASAPAYELGPFGVAADDSISSPNLGQVYTTTHPAGGGLGLVWIHEDASLVPAANRACMSIYWTDSNGDVQTMSRPTGIALDDDGNLYVVDSTLTPDGFVVLKVDAADIAYPGMVCISVEASQVFDTIFGIPTDVSVDKSGRVHVCHTCGCVPVFFPDGSLCGIGSILTPVSTGIDAKDDILRTRVTGANEVREWNWDIPTETRTASQIYGVLDAPRGLEYQKYLRQVSGGSISEERVFVVDAGSTAKVSVFGKDVSSTGVPSGAVARWRFDDPPGPTCFDDIGGHDLVLGGLPERVTGKIRCGLGFEDTTGEAWLAHHPDFDFGTGDFSIEGWVCAEYDAGVAAFLDKRDGINGFSAYLYNGYLSFQLMSGSSFENLEPAFASNYVADGKWHHIAITVKRAASPFSVTLYVDGIATAADTTPLAGSVSSSSPLVLGHNGFGSHGITGRLDDFGVYRKALSPVEVRAIENAQGAGKHSGLVVIGNHYCNPAAVNATGLAGAICATGSATASDNDVTLKATDLTPMSFGFFIVSAAQGFVPNPGGSYGNLCLSGAIGRYQNAVQNSGLDGAFDLPIDLNVIPGPTGSFPALPGISLCFQAWYRDVQGGVPGSNFTNGLQIDFM